MESIHRSDVERSPKRRRLIGVNSTGSRGYGHLRRPNISKFDESSGLVYQQSECKEQKYGQWTKRAPTKTINPVEPKISGSRSLRETSLNLVMDHFNDLNTAALHGVPWSLGKHIWQRAVKR